MIIWKPYLTTYLQAYYRIYTLQKENAGSAAPSARFVTCLPTRIDLDSDEGDPGPRVEVATADGAGGGYLRRLLGKGARSPPNGLNPTKVSKAPGIDNVSKSNGVRFFTTYCVF